MGENLESESWGENPQKKQSKNNPEQLKKDFWKYKNFKEIKPFA